MEDDLKLVAQGNNYARTSFQQEWVCSFEAQFQGGLTPRQQLQDAPQPTQNKYRTVRNPRAERVHCKRSDESLR